MSGGCLLLWKLGKLWRGAVFAIPAALANDCANRCSEVLLLRKPMIRFLGQFGHALFLKPTDEPPAPERRRGSLPLLCAVGLVWLLFAHPEVGAWLVWAAGEALMYAVSLPALYGAAYFALQYLTTLCLRPNTTRIHWSTVALGYGLLASLFLLAAGPLLGRWLEGTEWRYTLPQVHGELPTTPLGELGQWQWPTVTWEARNRGFED